MATQSEMDVEYARSRSMRPDLPWDSSSEVDARRDDVPLSAVLTPIIRGWRQLLGMVIAVSVVTFLVLLVLPRKYAAKVTMAAVSGTKGLPLSAGLGLASSLLGAMNGMGLQATPALIVQLGDLHGVVYAVALSKVDSATGGGLVIERITGKPLTSLRYDKIGEEFRRIVKLDYDRQTGIIALTVTHKDSALARVIANRLVAAISAAFLHASRAQAAELRHAQDARVDTAARQLAVAERQLVEFLSANRSVQPYTIAAVERDRLQRAIDMAQTIFTQAATDREAAAAKELEATPAVVVLDPVSDRLLPVSKQILLFTAVAALLAAIFASVTLIARYIVRRNRELQSVGA